MDIALQTFLSYQQMVGVGAQVADGRLLGSLTSFHEMFESYPNQKSMGKLLYTYCWPCTVLVPFLAEPLVAYLLPWFTAQKLVGANKKIQGKDAIKALELREVEQGRWQQSLFFRSMRKLFDFPGDWWPRFGMSRLVVVLRRPVLRLPARHGKSGSTFRALPSPHHRINALACQDPLSRPCQYVAN